ncbi:unnamed protein product [Meganyctiphanes norvegica]|uniref:Uncharacterized protein n=1 Tax=Meganyctiphanes norvegica TaxID=48144 RepID=A0AAV2SDK7_MEGNR
MMNTIYNTYSSVKMVVTGENRLKSIYEKALLKEEKTVLVKVCIILLNILNNLSETEKKGFYDRQIRLIHSGASLDQMDVYLLDQIITEFGCLGSVHLINLIKVLKSKRDIFAHAECSINKAELKLKLSELRFLMNRILEELQKHSDPSGIYAITQDIKDINTRLLILEKSIDNKDGGSGGLKMAMSVLWLIAFTIIWWENGAEYILWDKSIKMSVSKMCAYIVIFQIAIYYGLYFILSMLQVGGTLFNVIGFAMLVIERFCVGLPMLPITAILLGPRYNNIWYITYNWVMVITQLVFRKELDRLGQLDTASWIVAVLFQGALKSNSRGVPFTLLGMSVVSGTVLIVPALREWWRREVKYIACNKYSKGLMISQWVFLFAVRGIDYGIGGLVNALDCFLVYIFVSYMFSSISHTVSNLIGDKLGCDLRLLFGLMVDVFDMMWPCWGFLCLASEIEIDYSLNKAIFYLGCLFAILLLFLFLDWSYRRTYGFEANKFGYIFVSTTSAVYFITTVIKEPYLS